MLGSDFLAVKQLRSTAKITHKTTSKVDGMKEESRYEPYSKLAIARLALKCSLNKTKIKKPTIT